VASFATGAVSLHTSGSWDLPITRRALSTTNEIDDLEVLPLPQVDPDNPRTVLGGSSLFVPVGAPNRELAFDLMLALTEDAVAVRLAAEEGRLPARTRVFGDELFASTPDLQAFVEQLDSAIVMPLIAYPEVAAAFRDALEDILAQRSTPEEAMDRVQRHAERWLEGR
jgi:multiple sugar transport system substrate-binding protein